MNTLTGPSGMVWGRVRDGALISNKHRAARRPVGNHRIVARMPVIYVGPPDPHSAIAGGVDGDGGAGVHSEHAVMDRLAMAATRNGVPVAPREIACIIDETTANVPDFLGRTILHDAAHDGNAPLAEYLLSLRYINIEATDWRLQTPLHIATERGHDEVAALLVTAGARIDARDAVGQTAMHLALVTRNDALILLLERRAVEDGVTYGRLCALEDAYGYSVPRLFSFMAAYTVGDLCERGLLFDARMMQASLFHDPDALYARDNMLGTTVMHRAASAGREAVVRWLLEEMAFDVADGCHDWAGRSPLHVAAAGGHAAVVRLLLRVQGMDAGHQSSSLRTPLLAALVARRVDAAVALLTDGTGLNVDAADVSGHTALSVACELGLLSVVRLLVLRHGASVHGVRATFKWRLRQLRSRARGAAGGHTTVDRTVITVSPLHAAVAAGSRGAAVALFLLDHGAGTGPLDDDAALRATAWRALCGGMYAVAARIIALLGRDAAGLLLHRAVAARDHAALVWLVTEGAVAVDAVDARGYTALAAAAATGDDKSADILLRSGAVVDGVAPQTTPAVAADADGESGDDMAAAAANAAAAALVAEGGAVMAAAAARARAAAETAAGVSGVPVGVVVALSRRPLLLAAKGGHTFAAAVLVPYAPELVPLPLTSQTVQPLPADVSPLHVASVRGDSGFVRALLGVGAPLNAVAVPTDRVRGVAPPGPVRAPTARIADREKAARAARPHSLAPAYLMNALAAVLLGAPRVRVPRRNALRAPAAAGRGVGGVLRGRRSWEGREVSGPVVVDAYANDHEQLAVFLCEYGIDIITGSPVALPAGAAPPPVDLAPHEGRAGRMPHPIWYAELAASKGMFTAAERVVELVNTLAPGVAVGAMGHGGTHVAGLGGGGARAAEGEAEEDGAAWGRRDAVSYAAAAGRGDLILALLQVGYIPLYGAVHDPPPEPAQVAPCGGGGYAASVPRRRRRKPAAKGAKAKGRFVQPLRFVVGRPQAQRRGAAEEPSGRWRGKGRGWGKGVKRNLHAIGTARRPASARGADATHRPAWTALDHAIRAECATSCLLLAAAGMYPHADHAPTSADVRTLYRALASLRLPGSKRVRDDICVAHTLAADGATDLLQRLIAAADSFPRHPRNIFARCGLLGAPARGRPVSCGNVVGDADAPYNGSGSVLYYAAVHGHFDTCRLLMSQYAVRAVDGPRGHSPLLAAVWYGDVDAAHRMLEGGHASPLAVGALFADPSLEWFGKASDSKAAAATLRLLQRANQAAVVGRALRACDGTAGPRGVLVTSPLRLAAERVDAKMVALLTQHAPAGHATARADGCVAAVLAAAPRASAAAASARLAERAASAERVVALLVAAGHPVGDPLPDAPLVALVGAHGAGETPAGALPINIAAAKGYFGLVRALAAIPAAAAAGGSAFAAAGGAAAPAALPADTCGTLAGAVGVAPRGIATNAVGPASVVGTRWRTVLHHAAAAGASDVLRAIVADAGRALQGGRDILAASPPARTSADIAAAGGHATALAVLLTAGVMLHASVAVPASSPHPTGGASAIATIESAPVGAQRILLSARARRAAVGGSGVAIGARATACGAVPGAHSEPTDRATAPALPATARARAHERALCELFVAMAADVEPRVARGFSYVHAAAARDGAGDCLRLLAAEGAELNAPFHSPYVGPVTPLWLATSAQHVDAVTFLLSQPRVVVDVPNLRPVLAVAVARCYARGSVARKPWALAGRAATAAAIRPAIPPPARARVRTGATVAGIACGLGDGAVAPGALVAAHAASPGADPAAAAVVQRLLESTRAVNGVDVIVDPQALTADGRVDATATYAPPRRRGPKWLKQNRASLPEPYECGDVLLSGVCVIHAATPLFIAASGGSDELVQQLYLAGGDVGGDASILWPPAAAVRGRRTRGARSDAARVEGARYDVGRAFKASPLLGCVLGAPWHPLMVTTRRRTEGAGGAPRRADYESAPLRAAVERYVRVAHFLVSRGALEGLSAGALSEIVLLAAAKGLWEVAAMVLRDAPAGGFADGTHTADDDDAGVGGGGRFLREVRTAVATLPGVRARHPVHVAAQHAGRELFGLFLHRSRRDDVAALADGAGHTALHHAVRQANLGAVEVLLRVGCDAEMRAPGGVTPLMLASGHGGNAAVAEMLLQAGASVNSVDTRGRTALHVACSVGQKAVVDLLLTHGADCAAVDAFGLTPTMQAAARGHAGVALSLLQYWAKRDELVSTTSSVLHCAASGGCLPVIEYLLAHVDGVRVFERDFYGHSAVTYAYTSGVSAVKRALLLHAAKSGEAAVEDGYVSTTSSRPVLGFFRDALVLSAALCRADATAPTAPSGTDGDSPSAVALRGSFIESVASAPFGPVLVPLVDKPVGGTALAAGKPRAAGAGPAAALLGVERAGGLGFPQSLLLWAAANGHVVAVRALGDHCVTDDCCALHVASERGHLDVVQVLLALDMSSLSQTDDDGRTALMRAVAGGQERCALFLLSKTSTRRLLRADKQRRNALHYAAIHGATETAQHILSHYRLASAPAGAGAADGFGSAVGGEGLDLPATVAAADAAGHSAFEYAVLGGHASVALRIAYAVSGRIDERGIPAESGFLERVVALTPLMRVIFFDVWGMQAAAAAGVTAAGTPGGAVTGRLRLPDLRVIGLLQLQRDRWAWVKLQEALLSVDHEQGVFRDLLAVHRFAVRMRFAFDSLAALPARKRLLLMQRLGAACLFGRYAEEALLVPPPGRKAPPSAGPFAVVSPTAGVSAVELEYVSRRGLAGVSVDASGTLHERFYLAPDSGAIISGDVDVREAVEVYTRRREKALRAAVDARVRDLNNLIRALPGVANGVIRQVSVVVDYASLLAVRGGRDGAVEAGEVIGTDAVAAAREREGALAALLSDRGLPALQRELVGALPVDVPKGRREDDVPVPPAHEWTAVVVKGAAWCPARGAFVLHTGDTLQPGALAFCIDASAVGTCTSAADIGAPLGAAPAGVRVSAASRVVAPLAEIVERERRVRGVQRVRAQFERAIHALVGGHVKFRVEAEGGAVATPEAFAALAQSTVDVVAQIVGVRGGVWTISADDEGRGSRARRAPPAASATATSKTRRPAPSRKAVASDTAQGTAAVVAGGDDGALITARALELHALRTHLQGVGVLISSRREPAARYHQRRLLLTLQPDVGGRAAALPAERTIRDALYDGVVNDELSSLKDSIVRVLGEAELQVRAYVPNATVSVDWHSFEALTAEDRFVAFANLAADRSTRCIAPLLVGLRMCSDGAKAQLRRHVSQVSIVCTPSVPSHITVASGRLAYHAALAAKPTPKPVPRNKPVTDANAEGAQPSSTTTRAKKRPPRRALLSGPQIASQLLNQLVERAVHPV